MKNSSLSFLARIRQRLFRHRIDLEIFHGIFPHLERERTLKYPFADDAGMAEQASALDPRVILGTIEDQLRSMPKAYSEAFRYIMYRDLHAQIAKYACLAQRRIPRQNRIPEFAKDCA